MFQTEPIKFLQSFATEWLTDFLLLVSQLGYSSFYIPAVILLTFGLNFRKGFLLTQMLVWVGIITDLLKNVIALPRPSDVDSGVKLLGEGAMNLTPFIDKGGTGFWNLPDPEAIRLFRSQPEWSFGLPSGHVSGTTTFWGGLSLLFRHAAVRAVALVIIVLMPISRMYLGRHFLADVLAGFLVAGVMLATGYRLFIAAKAPGRLLNLIWIHLAANVSTVLFLMYLLLLPAAVLLLSPLAEPEDVGRLLGLNVAFVLLALRGLPDDEGTLLRRSGRVIVAFALYVVADWLIGMGIKMRSLNGENMWIEVLMSAIPAFVVLWGGVRVNLGIGLYKETVKPE